MSQQTYFINCPHCSKIIEVVCPDINRNVWRVTTESQWYGGAWGPQTTQTMRCPECFEHFSVMWWYNKN